MTAWPAGSAVVAVVDRVGVRDGHVVVDCSSEDGRAWTDVPLMTVGGGASTWGAEPVELPRAGAGELPRDRVQVVLVQRGPYEAPIALGMLPAVGGEVAERAPTVAAGEDHPGTVGKADFARVNGGARLIVDEHGAITLDVRDASAPTVRVQLPADGVLRVSRGGDASERLALAGPLVEHLEAVHEYLAAVKTWAASLAINPTTYTPVVPFPATPPALHGDALRAATVHVSEDTEASP